MFKKLLCLILAIIALVSGTSCSSSKKAAGNRPAELTARIGTFNLWRSDLGKDEYAWAERKGCLAEAIVRCDFDIFAGEEVDERIAAELPELVRSKGGKYTWWTFSPYREDGVGARKAQAVVYKTDKYEMVESHHFWYSETPDVMSSGWDEMKFKRGGCCFTFRDKATSRLFFVMVSHMPLGREANFHAAAIVVDKARQYNPSDLPAFFMGDLNTREERNSSELLRTYWTDSYLSIAPELRSGPRGTFNSHNIEKDMQKAPRIDYVYYRGASITPLRYVVDTTIYNGIYPSDHCPLYVDFRF